MDVISNIDAVGNDLAFGPGICGKVIGKLRQGNLP